MLEIIDERKMRSAIERLRTESKEAVGTFFKRLFEKILEDKENSSVFCKEYCWPEYFKKFMYQIDEKEIFVAQNIEVKIFYNGDVRVTIQHISDCNGDLRDCIEEVLEEEGFLGLSREAFDEIYFHKSCNIADSKEQASK